MATPAARAVLAIKFAVQQSLNKSIIDVDDRCLALQELSEFIGDELNAARAESERVNAEFDELITPEQDRINRVEEWERANARGETS